MNDIKVESQLIGQARAAISDSNWLVGEAASQWLRRYSRGRGDVDFAALVGLTADQVWQRRRVWEMFSDVRAGYPYLLWGHFFAAVEWDDAPEVLRWANDVRANVPEMRAWRRAQHGEDALVQEPRPARKKARE